MRPAAVALLAALAALASACEGRTCDEGEVRPCTCVASGRGGRERCTPDGNGFEACDCGEVACPPGASETCRAGELHRADACGNVETVPSEQCTCGCSEGSSSCDAWAPPAAMTVPAACHDATACLVREPLLCVQLPDAEGLWVYGFRLVNLCDQDIRCYVYQETSDAHPIPGGVWREGTTSCLAPPLWPFIAPADPIVGWTGLDSEGDCRARFIESPNRHELRYTACVLASDPVETCAPDLPRVTGESFCAPLAPACTPG